MNKAIGFYPRPDIDTAATAVVSHAGTVLLTETIGQVGLDRALSAAGCRACHDSRVSRG